MRAGTQGALQRCSEEVLRVLRANAQSLLTIVQVSRSLALSKQAQLGCQHQFLGGAAFCTVIGFLACKADCGLRTCIRPRSHAHARRVLSITTAGVCA